MSKTASAPLTDESVAADAFVLARFAPYRIVALGREMSRRLAQAYADEDVAIPEWRVLATLSQADALAARDVVAMTPMDKMAVSRAVANLEAKGYVRRRADPGDGRVVMVSLTDAGRRLFQRIAAMALDYEARLLSALTKEERAAFDALLSKLEASAQAE
ncbi:MAG: MarR family winged helix-turn-helix transcriptional regulator [Parvularculaceae bacterium]